jgi:hypothetical protein
MTKFLWVLTVTILSTSLARSAPVASHRNKADEGPTSSSGPLPQAAPLSFHLINVNEVYSNADGTLQYVELITLASGQTNLSLTRITSLDAAGTAETVVFDFTASFSGISQTGSTLLVATRAFETLTGVRPDFVISDQSISLLNGRILFKPDAGSPIDAVAYGAFTGSNAGFGSAAPALPRDGTNSLTRRSSTRNNANDFMIAPSSPRPSNGNATTVRGGPFVLALLSDTDEIIRIELATGNVVQRVPAGFDVKNSSGIDIGTAAGVNNGNPFVVVTQVGEPMVRLYDGSTLMSIGAFAIGPNDVGWDGVGFDGTNWLFSVSDGVVGDPTFQGADLIDLSASVSNGMVMKFASINLNSPNDPFDVSGGIGFARPGVAAITGFTGMGSPALAQITINNNSLTRGATVASQAGNASAGVSGRLVTIGAANMLVSAPGTADLRIIDPRTGQQVRTVTINGVDFTGDVAPDNAMSGLSSETTIGPPR